MRRSASLSGIRSFDVIDGKAKFHWNSVLCKKTVEIHFNNYKGAKTMTTENID